MPQVRCIIVLEGFHIGNQTATYRQHSQDENKKRKCQPDPPKRQSVMFGILPHHEEKQERQDEERKKRIDAIRAKVKKLTCAPKLWPDGGGEALVLVENERKGRNQEDADRQKRCS